MLLGRRPRSFRSLGVAWPKDNVICLYMVDGLGVGLSKAMVVLF